MPAEKPNESSFPLFSPESDPNREYRVFVVVGMIGGGGGVEVGAEKYNKYHLTIKSALSGIEFNMLYMQTQQNTLIPTNKSTLSSIFQSKMSSFEYVRNRTRGSTVTLSNGFLGRICFERKAKKCE